MKNRGSLSLGSSFIRISPDRATPGKSRCDRDVSIQFTARGFVTCRSRVPPVSALSLPTAARRVRSRHASTDSSTADLLDRVFGHHRDFQPLHLRSATPIGPVRPRCGTQRSNVDCDTGLGRSMTRLLCPEFVPVSVTSPFLWLQVIRARFPTRLFHLADQTLGSQEVHLDWPKGLLFLHSGRSSSGSPSRDS